MPTVNEHLLDSKTARDIAELHFANVSSGKAIKNLPKRQVSRVVHESGRFVVKSYHVNPFQRLFHCYPFQTDYATLLDGLTPPLRANFAFDFSNQVTITDDAGPMDMFSLFGKAPLPSDFEKLYSDSGTLLAKIHERQIFHADAKPPNFVVNQNLPTMPPVLIIDCDKVKRFHELPKDKKVFNIAQFLACNSMNFKDNLPLYKDAMQSFLDAYARECHIGSAEMLRLTTLAVACALGNRRI